ncbi:MAG: tRNA (guanosine(37)-N1)-methyltransferase TrmD [Desulfobacula sp.]|uniref:tRNA (guanosine(37)-N1)-methyltransferase TrmD n=1 Tax=Desulfobacula sp. TaxID=2593537 RepID=UPI0025C289A3|nr:tRNA (guanosine(37)-N1)-methyltransferase TrmD [Desulfobacula sp.]MBC2703886.1 tRNA (guanosine(37)-N1)-methyltransferase TrmD [Desulfobacula sp.]MCK4768289.1 tRNA (guanosine(37)-N1)-methyltransferase TrmD [Desulfobacula sp.]MCK5350857.1 tRNA (guanosine(37)-N1)-methyltransferase TrmD [Desulfobacula sp.]
MDFTVLTLFPELISSFFEHGMMFRGIEKKLITGHCINIRDFSTDRHNTIDDRPYGGGSGMVMKQEPLKAAILAAKKRTPESPVVLMTPQGTRFNQEKAMTLALQNKGLIFVCGRYEGIDERITTTLVDEEISIGDYVMTGGELASMVIIDSIARLIPGVLGSPESSKSDSFTDDRLEYAQYTRPEDFEGLKVPEVLLSGNHGKINQWRKKSSLQHTFLKRPDLFKKTKLSAEEKKIIKQWCQELEILVRE